MRHLAASKEKIYLSGRGNYRKVKRDCVSFEELSTTEVEHSNMR